MEFSICPICTEELQGNVVTTKCGHVYHELCLSQWLDNDKSVCPTCRARTLKKDLLKIFLTSAPEVGFKYEEFETCKKSYKELVISYDELLAIKMTLEQELSGLRVSENKQLKNLKDRNTTYGKKNAKLNDEIYKSQQFNKQLECDINDLNNEKSSYKVITERSTTKLNDEIYKSQLLKTVNTQLKCDINELNNEISSYKVITERNTTKLNDEIDKSQLLKTVNTQLKCDINDLNNEKSSYKVITERNTTKLNDEIYKSQLLKTVNTQLKCDINELNNEISSYKVITERNTTKLNDEIDKSQLLKTVNTQLKCDINELNNEISSYKVITERNTTKLNDEIYKSQLLKTVNTQLKCDINELNNEISSYKVITERNTNKLNDEIYKSQLLNNQLTCVITDLNKWKTFSKKKIMVLLKEKVEMNDALNKLKNFNGQLKREDNNLLETSSDSRDKLDRQKIPDKSLYKGMKDERGYELRKQINELTKDNETLQKVGEFGIRTIDLVSSFFSYVGCFARPDSRDIKTDERGYKWRKQINELTKDNETLQKVGEFGIGTIDLVSSFFSYVGCFAKPKLN